MGALGARASGLHPNFPPMPEAPGWHSRGYLPHYDDGVSLQAVTYRLADALPAEAVGKL